MIFGRTGRLAWTQRRATISRAEKCVAGTVAKICDDFWILGNDEWLRLLSTPLVILVISFEPHFASHIENSFSKVIGRRLNDKIKIYIVFINSP